MISRLKKTERGEWELEGMCINGDDPDAKAILTKLDNTADLRPDDNILVEGDYAGRANNQKPPSSPIYNPPGLPVTGVIPSMWRGYAVKFTSAVVLPRPDITPDSPPMTLGELKAAFNRRNKADVIVLLGNPTSEVPEKTTKGYNRTTVCYFPNTLMIDKTPIPGKTVELMVRFEDTPAGPVVTWVDFVRGRLRNP